MQKEFGRKRYREYCAKLKEKELDVLRDVLDGVRADKNNLTINDLYFTL